jgi:hypothetical protein
LRINNGSQILFNGDSSGLKATPGVTNIGDVSDYNNQSKIEVNDLTRIISTSTSSTLKGFRLDFSADNYFFGDYGSTAFGLTIDVFNTRANLFCSQISILTGNASGFFATGNISVMGDVDGNGNSTIFEVDDNQQSLIASGNLIGSLGLGTSDRLKIRIGGTDYLIVLEQA